MSREYPTYPLVGVGAVVIRDGSILLIRRGAPPNKGKWSVPGGLVEVGESLETAVIRELHEEVGLRGTVIGLVGVYEYIEKVDNRVKYHYIILDYLVDAEGTPIPGSDAEEARFVDLHSATSLDLTESTRKLIDELLASGTKPLRRC